MLSRLASAPLAERVEIPGLHPDRAPTIVAGVVILIETMRAFGLERDRRLRARHPLRRGDRGGRRSDIDLVCQFGNFAVPSGQHGALQQDKWVRPMSEPQKSVVEYLPIFSSTALRRLDESDSRRR